ncbi:MAG: nicotinate-nucleotide--dimethylbenzimidazole phosphoribosyltransferase [Acidimicrobiaceae bacterium]|nr:nicotinate-nucleotide--dimethylbenzimidazole phosphoribosyltransferase [Acidimicrobiaceae bacterium]
MNFKEAVNLIKPRSETNYHKSLDRQAILTKPAGALGVLEDISNKYSSISDQFPPSVPQSPVVCVFASDHGVLEEGITPWPQEVTIQMVANFLNGGAAINAIAKQVGAKVSVIDIGVAGDTSGLVGIINKKVRLGTDNLAKRPAMSLQEAEQAIQAGFDVATSMIDAGSDLLVIGDMGIGNTTPSAALISWFTKSMIEETTGRGTGIDDDRMVIKIGSIRAAHKRLSNEGVSGPIEILGSIGGLEIAGMVGLILAGSYRRVPVVLDGVIADAAAVVSYEINNTVRDFLFAGHLSQEPGAQKALDYLSLKPILTLDLRLGEGTGGCLSIPVIQSAVRTLVEMATFDSAGVSGG